MSYSSPDTRRADAPIGVSSSARPHTARLQVARPLALIVLGALAGLALGALTILWGGRGRSAALVGAIATICTVSAITAI